MKSRENQEGDIHQGDAKTLQEDKTDDVRIGNWRAQKSTYS
jgi:hypothetical protein